MIEIPTRVSQTRILPLKLQPPFKQIAMDYHAIHFRADCPKPFSGMVGRNSQILIVVRTGLEPAISTVESRVSFLRLPHHDYNYLKIEFFYAQL